MLRAGFGLLSLLICAAIFFYISFGAGKNGYEGAVMEQKKVLGQQAQQIAGKDENNIPVGESIVLDDVLAGSELRAVKVVSVIPTGPMAVAYGLLAGDEIIQAEQMDLRGSDPGTARALVVESYSKNSPLVIMRNGQEMTLTPKTPLSEAHPDIFGKPGTVLNPNAPLIPQGQAVPSH